MLASTIWDQVLSRIEAQVGKHSFSTWFKPTSLLVDGGSSLRIRVPNLLFVEWLPKHYSVVLAEALRDVGRGDARLVFVPDGAGASEEGAPSAPTSQTVTGGQARFSIPSGPRFSGTPEPEDAEMAVPQRAGSLIPRYTFDSFIVGPSNQFANAACRAVAETPSRSYNPLFIHGGVGLGKTHLMHAIGHYVVQHHPGLALTYISSERFMNEMINAVRFDRILDFRSRYRSVDVLLVDDIQFVSGKEGTQNEFFHTFNALHDAQKQIVISSDRPPHEIPALEERLRSRFEWGLIADINPPDIETKAAILKKKAEGEAVPLPDNVAMYMASRIKTNIRELEGSLIRLIAYASLTEQTADDRTGAGCIEERARSRREGRDDRADSKVRGRLLPVEVDRTEVAQQLEVGRHAAPGGDVSLQIAHPCVASGDRPQFRRQTSLDGDSFHQEGRGDAKEERRFR